MREAIVIACKRIRPVLTKRNNCVKASQLGIKCEYMALSFLLALIVRNIYNDQNFKNKGQFIERSPAGSGRCRKVIGG